MEPTFRGTMPCGLATSEGGSVEAIIQFLELWPKIAGRQPLLSGTHYTKTTYEATFAGRIDQSRASLKYKILTWLVMRNRCWSSDRLAKRGLPHQQFCPVCCEHDKTMEHLPLQCMFAHKVSSEILHWIGLHQHSHQRFHPRLVNISPAGCASQASKKRETQLSCEHFAAYGPSETEGCSRTPPTFQRRSLARLGTIVAGGATTVFLSEL